MNFRAAAIYLLTGLTLLYSPIKSLATEINQRTIQPTFTATAPAIDGILESIWEQATPYTDFRKLSMPGKGEVEETSTTVQFLYDDEALYVGVQAQKLEDIVAFQTINDNLEGDDSIKILIDPQRSESSVYCFGTNLLNTRLDTHFLAGESIDWDDVHWQASSSISKGRYTIEFKIPWDGMKVSRDTDEFGINVIRYRPQSNVTSALQFSELGEEDFSNYAILTLPSSVGKDRLTAHITPSLTYEVREDNSSTSLGIDNLRIRYGDFSGYFTYNPSDDIIEADPHVSWNLSGDEIRLPERREFFSAVGALFNMGRDYFYSRRLGNLTFGGTETFERANLRIGLRNIFAEEEGDKIRYDVGRIIIEGEPFGSTSKLGGYFVNSTDQEIDQIGVIDWRVKKDQFSFSGEVARTSGEGSNEENHALWSQVAIVEPQVHSAMLQISSTGVKYIPQIGYQPITGTKSAVIIAQKYFDWSIGGTDVYINPFIHGSESQHQSRDFFSNYYHGSVTFGTRDDKFMGRYVTAKGKRDLEDTIYANTENVVEVSYAPSPSLSFNSTSYFGESYGYDFLNNAFAINLGIEERGNISLSTGRYTIKDEDGLREDWVSKSKLSFELWDGVTLSGYFRHSSLKDELIANARIGYSPTPSTEMYFWVTSQTDLEGSNTDYQANLQVNHTFDVAD